MADSKALQENAADPVQVKFARRKASQRLENEISDLRVVLASQEGRRVFWRLLEHCKVFESIFDTGSQIYANAARQDVGHFIMAKIDQSDDQALFKMMTEHRDAKKREAAEIEADRIDAARKRKEESDGR